MNPTDLTDWVKSTASQANGNCVELRRCGGNVEVRDSKDRGRGPILAIAPATFSAWLNTAKAGDLDDLI